MDKLRPKKHLGQHFLADENIAVRIVEALGAPASGPVVEIGPGMGVLTRHLLDRYEEVHVVEYDPDAVAYLKEAFPTDRLTIHPADFLKWDIPEELSREAWFIGNLPYNVSSPIFFHLLKHLERVPKGVFMVQKEVADRVCAPESAPTKQKGILSVLVNLYFQTRMELKVKPTVFRPPPKVMSAVFSMERLPNLPEADFETLKQVVKAAYGKRRKTLRNALASLDIPWENLPGDWATLRAEALPYAAFVELANSINPESHG